MQDENSQLGKFHEGGLTLTYNGRLVIRLAEVAEGCSLNTSSVTALVRNN